MPKLTLSGDQIGQALQVQTNGVSTTIEIGHFWFQVTDVVTLTPAPGVLAADGTIAGGNGSIIPMTVTTAMGEVTTFGCGPDGLDTDSDPGKNGPDFLYVSENPLAGFGGAQ